MLTKQSVVKSSNDNCIIASISSLIENSSLHASSIMLSKNDIDNMKTVFPDLTAVIQHFIYSLSRQFSAHVIAFLAESSKYIDDYLNQLRFLKAVSDHKNFYIGELRFDTPFNSITEKDKVICSITDVNGDIQRPVEGVVNDADIVACNDEQYTFFIK